MLITPRTSRGKTRFPIASIAFYGPNNERATKVAAAVFLGEDQPGPSRCWFNETGDVREDEKITEELTEFLKGNGVVETAIVDRIIGCPHEEGKDYPAGGVCPDCSFWWNMDRWTHEPLNGAPARQISRPGRNDLCLCGSGKKFKKCCGAA